VRSLTESGRILLCDSATITIRPGATQVRRMRRQFSHSLVERETIRPAASDLTVASHSRIFNNSANTTKMCRNPYSHNSAKNTSTIRPVTARQNRRDIFDPSEAGCFYAAHRTFRRAWLCGSHPVSGKPFEHRRTWIQNRLAASFRRDCLSFEVMVNNIHVILRNRPDIVSSWTDEEVAKRWWRLFALRKNNKNKIGRQA